MNIIKSLFDHTRKRIEQTSHGVRDKIDQLMNRSTLSVSDVATFVMLHPETNHQRKEWLGLVFHFYRLQAGNVKIDLEMKGEDNEYILECKIQDDHGIVSHYRSYEKKSVDSPLKLPARGLNIE